MRCLIALLREMNTSDGMQCGGLQVHQLQHVHRVNQILCKFGTFEEVRIRWVGIPMHVWSQKVFQEIGEVCGGRNRAKKPHEVGENTGGQ